jgi:outer membrane immunogenic protein
MTSGVSLRAIAAATFGLLLTASGSFAADLPSRKGPPVLPPPPPPPLWTGFYAGLNIGYGAGTNSNVASASVDPYENFAYQLTGVTRSGTNPVVSSPVFDKAVVLSGPSGVGAALSGNLGSTQSGFSNTQNGVIGGGQIGYNYQWGPSFVLGVEADIQGTGIRGTSHGVGGGFGLDGVNVVDQTASKTVSGKTDTWRQVVNLTTYGAATVNTGVNWLGTVRGRIGYLWTPTLLVYATGGLTYGGVYANVRNYSTAGVTNTTWIQIRSATSFNWLR